MAILKTLTAVDPVTGAHFSRRTARGYVAAIVCTTPNGLPALISASVCQQWASRPDLAQAALAKALKSEPTARLAPVTESTPAPAPYVTAGQAALALAADREAQALKAAQAAHRAAHTPAPEPTPRTPAEAQAVAGLSALKAARAARAARAQAQAQPLAQAVAQALPPQGPRFGATSEPARPTLPGKALPPAPVAQDGPAPVLPVLQAQAWQARPATAEDLPPAARPDWMLAPWAGQPLPELRAWHPAG